MTWPAQIEQAVADLRASHLLRSRRTVRPMDAVRVRVDGTTLVNFCSNDYLGLCRHPAVVSAAAGAARRYGAGSGAAPLVTGYTEAHASAEEAIARWKGAESAILLPSGYQANVAAVQTIAAVAHNVLFIADKLVHASLIDALRRVPSSPDLELRFYPHNQLDKVRRLALSESATDRLSCIVSESVFSMDGDLCDLKGIADLRQEAAGRSLLLLDEAHASGVFGEAGAGLATELGFSRDVDVTVVTFSKAAGVAGGAICGTRAFCDAAVSLGRAYLFSTSPPSSTAAAIEAAIGVMRDEPDRQRRLRARCRQVRARLTELGLLRQAPGLETPIVPIVLGDESAALAASARLAEQGYLVTAIRPPTVARGTSRLRIALSSEHTDEQMEGLLSAIQRLELPRC